ncbi:hypothetical protein [Variovorax sp. PCZ-1]|uniref:hypothetical protein n=1 Tax=Variovorax sp. PCZ-1 TaxID=2835533 RepID=UPI0020C14144|nr:hypothetical protein [Variovorax sp. PCZ-1]
MNFLLRLVLILAGLIFAASLLVVMSILLLVWAVRAVWFKLTGRSVLPFAMRMNPRAGFEQVFRQAQKSGPAAARAPRHKLDDVTDVEPKL